MAAFCEDCFEEKDKYKKTTKHSAAFSALEKNMLISGHLGIFPMHFSNSECDETFRIYIVVHFLKDFEVSNHAYDILNLTTR